MVESLSRLGPNGNETVTATSSRSGLEVQLLSKYECINLDFNHTTISRTFGLASGQIMPLGLLCPDCERTFLDSRSYKAHRAKCTRNTNPSLVTSSTSVINSGWRSSSAKRSWSFKTGGDGPTQKKWRFIRSVRAVDPIYCWSSADLPVGSLHHPSHEA